MALVVLPWHPHIDFENQNFSIWNTLGNIHIWCLTFFGCFWPTKSDNLNPIMSHIRLFWTPLSTLKSDVIHGRSPIYCQNSQLSFEGSGKSELKGGEFWQISSPYLNQREQFMPTKLLVYKICVIPDFLLFPLFQVQALPFIIVTQPTLAPFTIVMS